MKKRLYLSKYKSIALFYTTLLSCLAIISIYFAMMSIVGHLEIARHRWLLALDIAIWAIFTLDYFARLYSSEDKKTFVKANVWDSLALIPVPLINMVYSGLIVDLLRLFRAIAFFDELRDGFKVLSKFKEVSYAFYFFMLAIITSSFGIYFAEREVGTVTSVGDALWWSVVTSTTVGYGDISPKTLAGRLIAIILMISGLCLLSILTAFSGKIIKDLSDKYSIAGPDVEQVQSNELVIDVSDLNEHEIRAIHVFIKHLKDKQ